MKNIQFKYPLLLVLTMLISYQSFAQATINKDNSAPDVSAMLDLKSTQSGLLIPRMSQQQRIDIAGPANGLLLFQNDGAAGFYHNAGSPESPTWLMAAGEGAMYEARIPLDSVCPSCGNDGFFIFEPGSYYLTRNMETTNGSADMINIRSDNVTLDLNGFTMSYVGTSGSFGTGIAINLRDNIVIQNGTIKGFKWGGISATTADNLTIRNINVLDIEDNGLVVDDYCTISNVIVRNCDGSGMVVGQNCIVTDCVAEGNGYEGFRIGTGSQVRNCTSTGNGEEGFTGISGDILIEGCTASENGDIGISLRGSDGVVRNCISTENAEYGIRVSAGTVANCNVTDNGDCVSSGTCTPSLGTDASARVCPEGTGICGTSRSLIYNNHSNDNVIGIFMPSNDGMTFNNYCEGNTHQGIVVIPRDAAGNTSGSTHMRNVCHNNGYAPNSTISGLGISAGEYYFTGNDIATGPIVNLTGAGNFLTRPFANHPQANFEY
ncbi:MAG: right-handed parallel beta-helix repeat-containing protein [Bacteroidota bacterium]